MSFVIEPLKFLREFFWIPKEPRNDLDTLIRRLDHMALNFEKLAEEVKQVQDTQASAIQVITTLKDELKSVANKLAEQDADTADYNMLVRLNGISSGYVSYSGGVGGVANNTTGFVIRSPISATDVVSGAINIYTTNGLTWVSDHIFAGSVTNSYAYGGGSVTLAAAISSLTLTHTTSQSFDAGSAALLYA